MEPDQESIDDQGRLDALGGRVRGALADSTDAAETVRRGRDRFLNAFHAGTQSRLGGRRNRPWLFAFSAAALAGAAATVALWERPLSFSVGTEVAAGELGQSVGASDIEVALAFSEGTRVVTAPRASLRVVEMEARRARVVLDRGQAHVSVKKNKTRKWWFQAGDFTVHVLGTRFDMAWNPQARDFNLDLHEGSVLIESPCLPGPRRLYAGEQLSASCRTENAVHAEKPQATPAPIQPVAQPAAALEPAPALAPPRAANPPGKAAASWRVLASEGRYADAIRTAENLGFDRLLRATPASELVELADAARLAGNIPRAAEASLRLRARFPRTPQAAVAAFSLGRLAFEQRHDHAQAATWFDRYLTEQPNGPLAGDAWGRLLEAREQAGQRAQARADATRYLQRFPNGPYASLAHRLVATTE